MSVSRVGRVLAGLALVVGVSACDDNPLAENRDQASYFRLNPSTVVVNAGGEVKVDAVVVNRYGAATNTAVTATPCDNKITAVADTGRSVYEYPERFVITGTANLGQSCLVVRGGGVTDTIGVRVVPASIKALGLDTLGSGESGTPTIEFRTTSGAPATGFTMADVQATALDPTIVFVEEDGTLSGRAPGVGRVRYVTRTETGATRVDTASIVVRAGAFSGTVSPSPAPGVGRPITFTAGNIQFDADTRIEFDGIVAPVVSRSATQMVVVVPGGAQANSQFVVANLGANQVASQGNINIIDTVDDPQAGNTDFDTATPVTGNSTFYVVLDDEGDQDNYFKVTSDAPRQVRLTMDWNDTDALLTIIGYTPAQAANTSCHTTAKPKSCTFTVPAGDYYFDIWRYTLGAAGSFSGVGIYPKVTGILTFEFL